MEDYDRVRRMRFVEELSLREISRQTGFHRSTVKKMIELSAPPGYQRRQESERPVLGRYVPVIDAILKSDGAFLRRCENVLAFGNPGSGKTHLLCGLGQELIRNGYRVYFASCGLLVQDLLIAKRELKLTRVLKRLSKFDVLILDDIGYVQQNRDEMEVLFTLLAERYEMESVMITSNC